MLFNNNNTNQKMFGVKMDLMIKIIIIIIGIQKNKCNQIITNYFDNYIKTKNSFLFIILIYLNKISSVVYTFKTVVKPRTAKGKYI